MDVPSTAAGLLGAMAAIFNLALMVFCVVVAWRGLRALEGIEESLRERGPR